MTVRAAAWVVATLLAHAGAGAAAAQEGAPVAADTARRAGGAPFPYGRAVLAGGAATAAGWLAGGLVGAVTAQGAGEDYDGLYVGMIGGATLLVPVGVHVANEGRGRLGPALAASAALAVPVAAVATRSWRRGEPLILALPVAQLVAAIVLERRTSRR